ncbi:GNAT family N-acetyltransferase [Streptomyces sp. DH24]|uniref:GNAT family N-acetyltransferase n=1 Tax=Streptomyces sp. DH24 TaxID=3040123 RepID=UPI002442A27D|nr:GNAT family N-acetyltransferase [Streptomyces sp. DH24]MDG9719230.1 GNAT family N-acetyltransferase [Streptomyces sp. DH24]
MRDIGAEQVEQAVAGTVALLRTVTERDWSAVPAGHLERDCHRTVVHIADDLIAYAGQLASRARNTYVPFEISLEDGTDNAGLLDVVETTGALLAAAVRTAPRSARAFHPYPFRSANREGFAAMGVAEVLLHTHDVAQGLGLAYEPPAELGEFVLRRIFPHVRPGADPWRTLLWATGRADLDGREPVTEWRWSNNHVIPADRLALEGVTPASAADLAAGGDGGFDWLGGGPAEGTRVGAELVVGKQYEAGTHRPEWGMYALVRHEDDAALGALGFHGVPDESGRVEVGYDLVEPARGHGYATEALRALTAWALAQDAVRVVTARVDLGNAASQRVLERAGFGRVAQDAENCTYERRG